MGCQYGDRKVCVCLLSFSGSAESGQANKKGVWPESGWALLVRSYEEVFFLELRRLLLWLQSK